MVVSTYLTTFSKAPLIEIPDLCNLDFPSPVSTESTTENCILSDVLASGLRFVRIPKPLLYSSALILNSSMDRAVDAPWTSVFFSVFFFYMLINGQPRNRWTHLSFDSLSFSDLASWNIRTAFFLSDSCILVMAFFARIMLISFVISIIFHFSGDTPSWMQNVTILSKLISFFSDAGKTRILGVHWFSVDFGLLFRPTC